MLELQPVLCYKTVLWNVDPLKETLLMLEAIKQTDSVVFDLICQEQARQSGSIRMIPSENYVSKAVMQATGT